MNLTKIFFKQFYDINKRDFWLLIGANTISGILLRYFSLNFFVEAGVVILLFFQTVGFMREASVMPSVISDFDRFSWKYLQSLPLNKPELIRALAISNLFTIFPLVVWLIAFFGQVSAVFTDSKSYELELLFKVFFYVLPALITISIYGLRTMIIHPRRMYSKNDTRLVFLNGLKKVMLSFCVLFYAAVSLGVLNSEFELRLGSKFLSFFKFIEWFIASWWVLPALIGLAFVTYLSTLKVWQQEHIGYVKINWKPRRDYGLILGSILAIMFPFQYMMENAAPEYAGKSELLKAVAKRDYAYLKKQKDFNQAGKSGFTPLLAAAYEGDLKLFQFIESQSNVKLDAVVSQKGSFEGLNALHLGVKSGNLELIKYLLTKYPVNSANPMTNATALHYAALKCHPQIMDLILEKNPDVNIQTKEKKNTALHLAAQASCFSTVSLLLDAGANAFIQDAKGKLAKSYLTSSPRALELAWYIEKRSRQPAGKSSP